MKSDDLALGIAGAVTQVAAETIGGNTPIGKILQNTAGATTASKVGATVTKTVLGLPLPPIDPVTAVVGISTAAVVAAIKYGEPADHSDDFFPAMSGLYSG